MCTKEQELRADGKIEVTQCVRVLVLKKLQECGEEIPKLLRKSWGRHFLAIKANRHMPRILCNSTRKEGKGKKQQNKNRAASIKSAMLISTLHFYQFKHQGQIRLRSPKANKHDWQMLNFSPWAHLDWNTCSTCFTCVYCLHKENAKQELRGFTHSHLNPVIHVWRKFKRPRLKGFECLSLTGELKSVFFHLITTCMH